MQGKQTYQERLFSTVNLSEMVPKNHILRRIDSAVNLDFIYDLTSELYCPDNGRRSIDPVLFFRMQLIRFLYGIESDRRLCEEVHLNLAYRWFCRLSLADPVPDHSSLTRIRDRFGVDIFRQIFERLIKVLSDKGFIKGKRILVDASIFQADAGIDSMEEREDSDPDSRELKQYEKRYHDFKTGKKKRKISNQTHVSKTDPDASLVSRPGVHKKLSYKAHFSADADSRFIVDCHATTGSKHECTILSERIEYVSEYLHLPIEEVTADKGYGRGPTYSFLRGRKIRAYIPLHDDNLGAGRISRGEFQYDRRKDRFKCPNGKYLYPYDKLEHGSIKRYRVIGGHCKSCPLRNACLPESQKNRARFIYRSPHQDEIDKIKRRQKTNHFKQKLLERKWKIEGLFGEAKQNHCLRRARYRGLPKVQIQLYMTAITQNFKRLVGVFLAFFACGVLSAARVLANFLSALKINCILGKLRIRPKTYMPAAVPG